MAYSTDPAPPKRCCPGTLGFALLLPFLHAAGAHGQTVEITTRDGHGADAYVSSAFPGNHGGEAVLRVSADPDLQSCDKTYLRFDLSALRGRPVASAVLTLQPIPGDPAPQDICVLGLRELRSDGSISPADLWRELPPVPPETRPGPITWKSAPANDPLSLGGYRLDPRQRIPGVSGGADLLGLLTVRADRPTSARLESPELVRFLNSDLTGVVTLVLTRASINTSPSLFAARQHPFLPPPRLTITLAPATPEQSLDRLLRFPVSVAGKPDTLGHQLALIQRKAVGESAAAALPLIDELARQMHLTRKQAAGSWAEQGFDLAAAFPSSQLAVARHLLTLLRTEIAFTTGHFTAAQWRHDWQAVLVACPDRGDELIHAARFALPLIWCDTARLSQRRERALLGLDIPPIARRALLELSESAAAPTSDPLVRARSARQALSPVLAASPRPPLSHRDALLETPITIAGKTATIESRFIAVQKRLLAGDIKQALALAEQVVAAATPPPPLAPEPPIDTAAQLVPPLCRLLIAELRHAASPDDNTYMAEFESVLSAHAASAATLLGTLDLLLPDALLSMDPAHLPRHRRLLLANLPLPLNPSAETVRSMLETPLTITSRSTTLEAAAFHAALVHDPSEQLKQLRQLAAALTDPAPRFDRRRRLARAAVTLALADIAHRAHQPGPSASEIHAELAAAGWLSMPVLQAASLIAASDARQPYLEAIRRDADLLATLPQPSRQSLAPPAPPVTCPDAADPHLLSRYIASLDEAGDEPAAVTFLDQLAATHADTPLGSVAALMRLARIKDLASREDQVISLTETHANSLLARVLRPAYTRALIRRNQPEAALLNADEAAALATARTPRELALAAVHVIDHITAPSEITPFLPRDREPLIDLLTPPSPLEIAAALAHVMRDEGDHLTSAHLCLAALEHAGHPFRHAITDDPLDDPLVLASPDASDAELPAISALLLASVQRTCNNTAAASALLDAALAADLPDDLHAHLLIEHARLMLASGDASRAAREVADVLTFCPAAAAIALARDIESAAPSQPVALLLTQLRRHLVAAEKAADLDAQFLSTAHAICLCHKLGYTQQAAALTRRATAASFAAPYTQLAVAHRYAQAELSPDKTLHEAAPQLRGDLTRYLAVPIRPPAPLVYYQSVEAARTATDPLQAAALAVRAIRSVTSPTRYRLAMPAYELIASAAPRAPHAQQALAQLLLHEEASSASPDQATNSRAAQFRRMLAEHFLAEPIDSIRPDPQPTASR